MTYIALAVSVAFIYSYFSLLEYTGHRWLLHTMRLAKRLGSEMLRRLCFDHMVKHHGRPYRHATDERDENPLYLGLAGLVRRFRPRQSSGSSIRARST